MTDMFDKVAQMAGASLKWVQVDKYALARGNQSISKKFLDGCTLYCLHVVDSYVGHYESAQDAKEAADEWLRKNGERSA